MHSLFRSSHNLQTSNPHTLILHPQRTSVRLVSLAAQVTNPDPALASEYCHAIKIGSAEMQACTCVHVRRITAACATTGLALWRVLLTLFIADHWYRWKNEKNVNRAALIRATANVCMMKCIQERGWPIYSHNRHQYIP